VQIGKLMGAKLLPVFKPRKNLMSPSNGADIDQYTDTDLKTAIKRRLMARA